MKTRNLLILSFFLLACIEPILAQGTATDDKVTDDKNGFALVQTNFTCESAERIKFDKTEYLQLDPVERVLLDAQWQSCQIAAMPEGPEQPQVVVIVNPTPSSDNDRLFYGLIRRGQLTDARKACATAGKTAGISLAVMGTASGAPVASEVGAALFKYSDVSCASLEKEFATGNILAVLAPNSIISHAVANKMTKDAINLIPLLSAADKSNLKNLVDKATSPPSITVGKKNVEVKVGGAKLSFKKPKFKI